jgi:hypothetical protein
LGNDELRFESYRLETKWNAGPGRKRISRWERFKEEQQKIKIVLKINRERRPVGNRPFRERKTELLT